MMPTLQIVQCLFVGTDCTFPMVVGVPVLAGVAGPMTVTDLELEYWLWGAPWTGGFRHFIKFPIGNVSSTMDSSFSICYCPQVRTSLKDFLLTNH
jgi:hypothetical protein